MPEAEGGEIRPPLHPGLSTGRRPGQSGDQVADDEPVLPDYGGACLDSVVPALLGSLGLLPAAPDAPPAPWLPAGVARAEQIVLLVVDGLGWEQLRERPEIAPVLTSLAGGPITSVVPTTTATALTSITTGLPPAVHEVMGYRVQVDHEVLNVLRWRTPSGDARETVRPGAFQTHTVFGGLAPPVVTRSEFSATGFTLAHLPGVALKGWQMASTMVSHVGQLLSAGEPFVYAYYDGIDKVAHEHGFGPFYDAEVAAADGLVAGLIEALPPSAALVVTADHGQVMVGDAVVVPSAEVMADVAGMSGEGRFRWLHARPGTAHRLAERAKAAYGDVAWVHTIDEIEAAGWYGGPLTPAGRSRVGDVALVPFEPVAFTDPADTGVHKLRCRHGSLTSAEMWVPLLAAFSWSAVPSASSSRARAGPTLLSGTRMGQHATVPEAPVPESSSSPPLLVVPAGEAEGERSATGNETVEQPAKVMRIGSMIKQLLEEVRRAPLDDASRTRMAEVYEQSVRELADGLSPDLREELARLTLPFGEGETPTEGELRVAQAQLVGWLEGLFHGIQATLFAQQMAAQAQLEQMRQRGLPPGEGTEQRTGNYL